MSNLVLPTIPSQGWSVFKTPNFKTLTQVSTSGKEVRAALWANPIWNFKLTWEVLKDGNGPPSDIDTFMDWFLARQGSFDSFLLSDPTDGAVTGAYIGFGDGVTKSFQLQRALVPTGFKEAIQNVNAVTNVYLADPQGGAPVAQGAFSYTAGYENLLLQSQAFDSTAWTKANATVTPDNVTAPDGSATADTVNFSVASTSALIGQAVIPAGALAGLPVAFSIWLKVPSGTQTVSLIAEDVGNGVSTIAVQTVTLTTSWQRFSIVGTTSPYTTSLTVYIYNPSAIGNYHFWGAQLERWPVVTGYLATTTAGLGPFNGILTFTTAPAANKIITADFSYYFRVRFKNDLQEFEQFMQNLWSAKMVELVSLKL